MKVSLDLMLEKYMYSQDEMLDWCFQNLTKFTWGVKSVAGTTYLYFNNPRDVEKFVDKWGDK